MFTQEELKQLIVVATKANPVHGLFFQTVYTHGMRISEALKLTPGNIRHGNLIQTRMKHGKRTTYPASIELQAHAATREPDEPLFRFYNGKPASSRRAADRIIKRYCKQSGIEPRSMHKLRFALVRHSREAGVPHAAITVHCGWRNPSTVHNYDRVSQAESQKAMAKAMAAVVGARFVVV